VLVFAIVVAICVLIGVVILNKVGILSIDVDLGPISPLAGLGVPSQ
jgi:hypothetical protein